MTSAQFLHNYERFITNVPGVTSIKHQLRAHKFSQKKLGLRVRGASITPEQELEFLTDYIIQIDGDNAVNEITSREMRNGTICKPTHD